jgi:CRP-like cAMP-binding protein
MAVNSDIENLKSIPLFTAFEPGALQLLVFGAETRLLRAGDVLFRRGEATNGGFIILAGSMALETHDDGRPADKIAQPWTLLGELSLILQGTHQVTAIARQPTTVLKISREMFLKFLEQNPAAAARLCELFRSRLAEFREHLKFDPES